MEPPIETDASLLTIALQDGFEEDLVVVRVDDKEVLRESAVTTDVRIGLAQSFETDVAGFPTDVTVTLPDRNLSGVITLETPLSRNLGVSVQDGEVRFRVSEQPFGYM